MSGKSDAKKKAKAEAAEMPQVSESSAEQEPKYRVEKLRQNSIQLFGVTVSTFDGAMWGNEEEELSINEAKKIINSFLYGGE